jgi:pantoate--beta-alanine ligase
MEILSSPQEMAQWRLSQTGSIGFVPTMGALHQGHAELIHRSVAENDKTVLSIFVNATQFNEQKDFEAYPRTFEADSAMAKSLGVSAVYAPTANSMYPDGFQVAIEPGTASIPMEGLSRPGHFRGVATVVVKLLHAVQPHNAYFGRKDFQQLAVVREVVRALDMSPVIIGVETIRDSDGLALSSRNVRLSPRHRDKAGIIWQALQAGLKLFTAGERDSSRIVQAVHDTLLSEPECNVEYVTLCEAKTLISEDTITTPSVICVAVRFGDVRLIDNTELNF